MMKRGVLTVAFVSCDGAFGGGFFFRSLSLGVLGHDWDGMLTYLGGIGACIICIFFSGFHLSLLAKRATGKQLGKWHEGFFSLPRLFSCQNIVAVLGQKFLKLRLEMRLLVSVGDNYTTLPSQRGPPRPWPLSSSVQLVA